MVCIHAVYSLHLLNHCCILKCIAKNIIITIFSCGLRLTCEMNSYRHGNLPVQM